MPAGRPTLYKPSYNQQAFKLCLLGATDKEMADFFEVCEDTIHEWKKVYPKFSESIRKGKVKTDMEVAHSLYKGTEDRVVKEQQAIKTKKVYWEDGHRCEEESVTVVEVEKIIPADFRNQQFWLKNRKSKEWRDKQDIKMDLSNQGKPFSLRDLIEFE